MPSLLRFLMPAAMAAGLLLLSVPGPTLAADADTWGAITRPALMSALAARATVLDVAPVGERLVAVGERGHILVSDDGGQGWRQVPSPTSVSLTAVRFADARHGWAVGHGGVILGTDDGGDGWRLLMDGQRAAELMLAAARAAGDEDRVAEAERLVAEGPDKPFFALVVLDARRVMAFGAYGLALRSDDGGATWQGWAGHVDNPDGWHVYAAARVEGPAGTGIVLAGEQGTLLASGDDGAAFAAVTSPYDGSLFGALAASPGRAVVFGLRGHAFASDDGGAHWQACAAGAEATLTAGTVLPDGRLLLLTGNGTALIGPADCTQWRLRPLPEAAAALGAIAAAALAPAAGDRPAAVVLAGAGGLFRLPLPSLLGD